MASCAPVVPVVHPPDSLHSAWASNAYSRGLPAGSAERLGPEIHKHRGKKGTAQKRAQERAPAAGRLTPAPRPRHPAGPHRRRRPPGPALGGIMLLFACGEFEGSGNVGTGQSIGWARMLGRGRQARQGGAPLSFSTHPTSSLECLTTRITQPRPPHPARPPLAPEDELVA